MTQAPTRRTTPAPARPAADEIGRLRQGRRLFGRYRLERRIGRGGSAEVWQAHDTRLDRAVAIKILHAHLLPDAASVSRFVTEARAAAGLSHPAIVPVYDVIDDPGSPAIVFGFVAGTTLADRIATAGPMAAREAARIGADLAGALGHAHRVDLVHRDVKPANVLIDGDGRVQLVDFGIARLVADIAARETATGQVVGTLRYMAPEQLAGNAVDRRTDLYALGLVLHELLAGKPAFPASSPAALVDAQRAGPPAPPAGTPSNLAALLAELLAVDPADRPPDAEAVEARLRSIAVEDAPADPITPDREAPLPPTIAPGLPAASAGIALVAAPSLTEGDAEKIAPADEAETQPFVAAPTASLAVLVADSVADPEAGPMADRPPLPRGQAGRGATVRPARAGAARSRIRRPGPVAIGGALAAIGAAILALAVIAFGRGPAVTNGGAASPADGLFAGQTPAPTTVAPSPKRGGDKGRGHGHNGGD
jgi:eukaryotic-like serine/threonine-protein kinase